MEEFHNQNKGSFDRRKYMKEVASDENLEMNNEIDSIGMEQRQINAAAINGRNAIETLMRFYPDEVNPNMPLAEILSFMERKEKETQKIINPKESVTETADEE